MYIRYIYILRKIMYIAGYNKKNTQTNFASGRDGQNILRMIFF